MYINQVHIFLCENGQRSFSLGKLANSKPRGSLTPHLETCRAIIVRIIRERNLIIIHVDLKNDSRRHTTAQLHLLAAALSWKESFQMCTLPLVCCHLEFYSTYIPYPTHTIRARLRAKQYIYIQVIGKMPLFCCSSVGGSCRPSAWITYSRWCHESSPAVCASASAGSVRRRPGRSSALQLSSAVQSVRNILSK